MEQEIPKAVQRQADEAERQIQALQPKAEKPKKEKKVEPKPEATPTPPVEAAPEPVDTPIEGPTEPEEATPIPEVGEPAQPVETPVEEPSEPVQDVQDTFEHKYQTLRGKYDSEVPALAGKVRELEDVIRRLQPPPLPSQPTPEPEKMSHPTFGVKDLPEDLRNRFEDQGFDEDQAQLLVDTAGFIAGQVGESTVSPVQEKLKNIEQTQAQTAEERFQDALLKTYPDLYQIIGSPEMGIQRNPTYEAFLAEQDPVYGATYDQLIQTAANNLDAPTVTRILKIWKDRQSPTQEQPQSQPRVPVPSPASQVVPDRGQARTVSPVRSEEKVYTESQLQEHYKLMSTRPTYRETEHAKRIEADIRTIMESGARHRVRPG
jgi:hypothetical protein